MPLTPEAASRICLHDCKARCCWGPQYLRLTPAEVPGFKARAAALGVSARVRDEPDGAGSVRYLEHDGERCPMLDGETWKCRIYADRPQRCREFPDRPRQGCAISQL